LRLITINQEQDRHYVDLIHETLIRARKDAATGKSVGYWPALYDYIDNNRDRATSTASYWRMKADSGKAKVCGASGTYAGLASKYCQWSTSTGLKRKHTAHG